ncbi:hypothetical protein BH24ACT24_BH24ACT24_00390 [soil metagenome]
MLVDTGLEEPSAPAQLERALHQAGLRLEHVRLLVCTHAYADHYGLAGPVVEAAGCELWMHPNHGHATRAAQAPERAGAPARGRAPLRRARGCPAALSRGTGRGTGIAGVVPPDRELVPGV